MLQQPPGIPTRVRPALGQAQHEAHGVELRGAAQRGKQAGHGAPQQQDGGEEGGRADGGAHRGGGHLEERVPHEEDACFGSREEGWVRQTLCRCARSFASSVNTFAFGRQILCKAGR